MSIQNSRIKRFASNSQSSIENSKLLAPAKLNIRLKVTGRRPDGYHELVSIMVPVGLFDHLELERTRRGRIRLTCQGLSIPDNEENLVYRAARAFFSRTGLEPGLSVRLTKNIPVAAGLGGGSSNAACTLKALNDMWSNPLTSEELAELSVSLGADIPFFLKNRPCMAKGIGEILEPIEKWPGFWYVIVTPPVKVSTAWVYANLKLKLTTGEYDSIITYLESESFDIAEILENDLETVTASHFPVISTIKKALVAGGAKGALMSGSGPSVFGIFESKDQAISAKKHLISRDLGDIFVVEGI
ncbi:MAG: 4-(cytidine 5'-diphospho)-2-C-methyl-D-erythritol kinase [Deltaproteobacteria bacterium]|nr:4-(cytidine 5'-diphospho)-2-C-methyl-D-erythritol kinase [Deltaproteobacteria bacterium]MBW2116571.1 4-(cytidine 5'-diphospho)-2-C-methyl-D-erythritol kinase [Deltaproteobacteria bacterium]MBW2344772.1 4-(cytidine 5'-diphospho)-2-C-methyl-D-erythritol kinase [Deltaproteobacteria bacterium]